MKNLLLIICSFLIVSSCKNDKIEYIGLQVNKTILQGQVLNNSFIFSWPDDMLIMDSLLVIHDSYKQDTCFHVFHRKTGKYLKSFGTKGRGPGEVLFPSSINYNIYNHTITTFEPNLKKIITYNLKNILQDSTPQFQEKVISTPHHFIQQAIPYKNTFMLREHGLQMRYGLLKPDNSVSILYNNYPKTTLDPEENSAIYNYESCWGISPDQTRMVSSTYIGSIVEIFDIQNDIHCSSIRHFYQPIFKSYEGCSPKWIATTPETIIGTDNLYCTNNYIYIIFQGEVPQDNVEKKKIIVLDWQGNACFQYELIDAIPQSIAVDEKERILYCIITNSKEEYVLCQYPY